MGINNDPNKSPQTSMPKVKSNNYAAFERDSELNSEHNKQSTIRNQHGQEDGMIKYKTTIHKEHK